MKIWGGENIGLIGGRDQVNLGKPPKLNPI